ncbi:MAG: CRISPR-associated endoribonuclease Cas6 [Anaerolineales bacterium]
MDLISVVFTLRPERVATLPGHLGRAAHAAFLSLVAARNPSLAQLLHESDETRPFTCSPLMGERVSGANFTVSPERTYWLRFTSIAPVLSPVLAAFVQDPPPHLELEGLRFAVEGCTSRPEDHGWAGEAHYEPMALRWLGLAQPAPNRWRLEFATPTAFRSGGKTVPVPLPELVFSSLVARWNAFAPVFLDPESVRRYAAECMALQAYDLRTRAVGGKGGSFHIGCQGEATYVALNRDRYWLGVINLLCDFVFYAGVGYQVAAGLGQARRIAK